MANPRADYTPIFARQPLQLPGHARLLAPLSDEPSIRQWADAASEVVAFSPVWVDQPEGPATPGGPDPKSSPIEIARSTA